MVNPSYARPTGSLYNLLFRWQEMGVYDIVLPFLLVFTISFAVLQKVKIFGSDSKKINVIVAFVIALLFLQNRYLIAILQRFLPNMSIIMIVALMFLLLVGIFGGEYKGFTNVALNIAFVFSLLATLIALSTDFFPGMSQYGILQWYYTLVPDPETRQWILFGIIILVVIGIVMYEKKPEETSYAKQLSQDIRNAFGRDNGKP